MNTEEGFHDEIVLDVAAGRGGDGCCHFHRERFVPRGGPDGGDGGRGGDVRFIADSGLSTLQDPKLATSVHAEDGKPGDTSTKTGANGKSVVLRLPVGTLVHLANAPEGSEPLVDLTEEGQEFIAARGGRGGRGNAQFATSTRQAPDFAEEGRRGEEKRLRLTLKLLADVGLIGLPNAGKSTLLRRISGAKPRVGAYPFTTLHPSLGVVEWDERRFVVADIPGLIEGASEGKGLGDRFLRHVERTRILVHCIDLGGWLFEGRNPVEDYHQIRRELGQYDPGLLERKEIIVASKVDLVPAEDELQEMIQRFEAEGKEILPISGATGTGIQKLIQTLAGTLDEQERIRKKALSHE